MWCLHKPSLPCNFRATSLVPSIMTLDAIPLLIFDGISSTNAVIHPSSAPIHSLPSSNNSMVLVSNDPSWWPAINANLISSYFIVAGSVGVVLYDWGLTLGQEVELIWVSRL
ncbi:hypothetical protein BDR04DRAFT_382154 [Suillus decipiens]|nr:hypothetical protein BDR04DRAFT_382154 [Suillus decipiens]